MYILNFEKQRAVLEHLELVIETDGGWTRRYRDPTIGQEWISFFAYPEYHGGGIQLLRHDPVPNEIEDWLELCFSSESLDDVFGLGMELSSQDDAWPEVIDWLERNQSQIDPVKVREFIILLGVLLPMNRRDPLGKSQEQVEADHAHFVNLADRAKFLVGAT